MVTHDNRGLILAFGGFAVLLTVSLLCYRPPAPLAADAPASAFSAGRAQGILQDLVGSGIPHPIGSSASATLRDLIVKRLRALGYRPSLQTGFVCNDSGSCGTPTNIVATFGDLPAGEDAVLLAAHYDSVPAGPGASDDGAGVASLLEIARILTILPKPRHPILLLLTDGEEAGLLGAHLFVRQHALAEQIRAAVNLEARGVSGPSLMFETGTANDWLMRLYAKATAEPITNSLYYVVYKSLPNATDFTVFKAAAVQGFNLAFIGDVGLYHTPLDSFANIAPGSIQHQGDNALGAVLALAGAPALRAPAGEAVFFDVLARRLIVMRASWALPTALAALLSLLVQIALLRRRGVVTGKQAAWGAAGALANIVLGGALCIAMLALLRAVHKLPPAEAPPWIAHPLALHIATAALAVLSAGLVNSWLAARAGFCGFWLGASLVIALLAVGVAGESAGAGVVLLLAAVASALAPLSFLGFAKTRTLHRPANITVLWPAFVLLAALLPLLLMLYSGIGTMAWPLATMTLCLVTSLVLPCFTSATDRVKQLVTMTAAMLAVIGLLASVFLPTYSAHWPQRVNVEYLVDADHAQAHWWVQAAALRLPRAMAKVVNFDPVPHPRFADYPLKGFFADALLVKLPAPQLEQISATPGAGKIHYELLLKSPRGAEEAFVVFPAAAGVEEVVISGSSGPQHAKLRKLRTGNTALLIAGIPGAGVQLAAEAAPGPMPVQVYDQSSGLPEELPDGKMLQLARPRRATSSQDGDVTVVERIVQLNPAAGR